MKSVLGHQSRKIDFNENVAPSRIPSAPCTHIAHESNFVNPYIFINLTLRISYKAR